MIRHVESRRGSDVLRVQNGDILLRILPLSGGDVPQLGKRFLHIVERGALRSVKIGVERLGHLEIPELRTVVEPQRDGGGPEIAEIGIAYVFLQEGIIHLEVVQYRINARHLYPVHGHVDVPREVVLRTYRIVEEVGFQRFALLFGGIHPGRIEWPFLGLERISANAAGGLEIHVVEIAHAGIQRIEALSANLRTERHNEHGKDRYDFIFQTAHPKTGFPAAKITFFRHVTYTYPQAISQANRGYRAGWRARRPACRRPER